MGRLTALLILLLVAGCSPARDNPAASPQATARPSPSAVSSASPRPTGDVTLAFAGDVHFAERVAPRLRTHPQDILGPIGAVLRRADIGMVNFESAITERGTPEPKQFHFRAPPSALTALGAQGVDVVTMANNHGVDYGPVGLSDTLAAVRGSKLPVIGVGANAAEAYAPYLATVRGTRIAILAASQISDRTAAAWTAGPTRPGIATAFALGRLLTAVRAARARADVVIVYLHWGTEGQPCPNSAQVTLARQLAAAGADAVVGTHAHLLLGAGWQGRTYVAYGLGNFLWWRDNAYSNDTGVLTLRVRPHSVVGATLTPARIDSSGVPLPVSGSEAARILAKFRGLGGCSRLSPTPQG
ncbi:MAG: CapA family protein [Actinomycetota bacterium]|nr:CapA family protein [Actinomycetota bacterium]